MASTYEDILKRYRAQADAISPMSVDDIVSEGVTHYTDSPIMGFLASMISPKNILKAPGKLMKMDGGAEVAETATRAKDRAGTLEKLDRTKSYNDDQITLAIKDAAKLAKTLKVSEKLAASPTKETVSKLIDQATDLPTGSSNRSKLAVKDLISTYLLPAKRRIEYNSQTPQEIISNLANRGLVNRDGELAEGVVRVIRGQKSPYDRLRTPLERYNLSNSSDADADVSNQAVFASKNADVAASYAGASTNSSGIRPQGRLPVSYPLYAKIDDKVFDATNERHISKVVLALKSLPDVDKSAARGRAQALLDMNKAGRQHWDELETPLVQQAMKSAGFKGFITDEDGPSSNIGMFNASDFLSTFSSGKPGTFDIQSFLLAAGLGGTLAATVASGLDSDSKDKLD